MMFWHRAEHSLLARSLVEWFCSLKHPSSRTICYPLSLSLMITDEYMDQGGPQITLENLVPIDCCSLLIWHQPLFLTREEVCDM